MEFTLKVVRGQETFRVPLEPKGQEPVTFKLVDHAVRRLWPELTADMAWYTDATGGIYVLEEPIFSDFLTTMRETGPGRRVLRLEMPMNPTRSHNGSEAQVNHSGKLHVDFAPGPLGIAANWRSGEVKKIVRVRKLKQAV
jgi:hypothetical protein